MAFRTGNASPPHSIRRSASILCASFLLLSACSNESSVSFQCPTFQYENEASEQPVSNETLQEMGGILGDFPRENAILEARAFLQKQNSTISDAMAADYIAAAYCRTFADDESMSDSAKTDRMRRWNRIITTSILDNDGDNKNAQ